MATLKVTEADLVCDILSKIYDDPKLILLLDLTNADRETIAGAISNLEDGEVRYSAF